MFTKAISPSVFVWIIVVTFIEGEVIGRLILHLNLNLEGALNTFFPRTAKISGERENKYQIAPAIAKNY